MASVRFLQRTRGISEIKAGEQQNPDPEKVRERDAWEAGCMHVRMEPLDMRGTHLRV